MTEWNKKNEKLIRDFGDLLEKQVKDFLNPKASVAGTALRSIFRYATTGKILKHKLNKAGMTSPDGLSAMQAMIELAEQNGSDAGEKIKKALMHAKQIEADFQTGPGGLLRHMKDLKKKGRTF